MSYTYPQATQVGGYNNLRQIPYTTPTWNAGVATPQVRPVASIEEVRASPIDFDGSVFYFPDIANKRIYTKFINMDGTVAINLYELKEMPTGQPVDSSYITRAEFESVITQLKMMYDSSTAAPKEEPKPTPQAFNF